MTGRTTRRWRRAVQVVAAALASLLVVVGLDSDPAGVGGAAAGRSLAPEPGSFGDAALQAVSASLATRPPTLDERLRHLSATGFLEFLPPVPTAEEIAASDAVIAPPPDSFDAPAAPSTPPPEALRGVPAGVRPQSGIWAVIIGIDDYPGSRSDLRSAVADADDMDRALARLGVAADRRLVLRDRQASAENVRLATDWLAAHAAPDATAVFFYAGHVRKRSGHEHMVLADGSMISDVESGQLLSRVRAREGWLVMAACYGGGFTEPLRDGWVLTAAADANHLAYENGAYGRSYLVEFLVRRGLLLGEAAPDVHSAYLYAERSLREHHPNRLPFQVDRSDGHVDLVAPGATPAAPPATAPPPPPEQRHGGGSPAGQASPAPPPSTTTTTDPRNDDRCIGVKVPGVHCNSN